MASRLDTILSLALGGGSTIPGGALNLSTVPGQITTLTNTQNTQATTISTLNNRPYQSQAYYQQRVVYPTIAYNQYGLQTINTLTVPSQSYARLMLTFTQQRWRWDTTVFTNGPRRTLNTGLYVDGALANTAEQSGDGVTMTCFGVCSVAAGHTSVVSTTVQVMQNYNGGTASASPTQRPVVYAVLIPWFGAALPLPDIDS